MINRYDYLTGEVLNTYETIKEASIDCGVSYHTVFKQLHTKIIKYPRHDWYFGYEPKPRWVINCYDNESRRLLAQYNTIKYASKMTGVSPQLIQWQVERDLEFDERFMGCTGLWFKRVVITD